MTDKPRWMVCLGSWGMHSNAATEDEAVHEALECLLDGEQAWLEPPNLKSLRAEVRSGLYRRVHESGEQNDE